MVSIFPDVVSAENAAVEKSDMVGLVLETLRVERLVFPSGDDCAWDTVCAGDGPLGEVEKLDLITSGSVV